MNRFKGNKMSAVRRVGVSAAVIATIFGGSACGDIPGASDPVETPAVLATAKANLAEDFSEAMTSLDCTYASDVTDGFQVRFIDTPNGDQVRLMPGAVNGDDIASFSMSGEGEELAVVATYSAFIYDKDGNRVSFKDFDMWTGEEEPRSAGRDPVGDAEKTISEALATCEG